MIPEGNIEKLFASARAARSPATPDMPSGFPENILRRYRIRVQENKAFVRTSVLSVGTALVILGTVLGLNWEMTNSSGLDYQESAVEVAYSVWDQLETSPGLWRPVFNRRTERVAPYPLADAEAGTTRPSTHLSILVG